MRIFKRNCIFAMGLSIAAGLCASVSAQSSGTMPLYDMISSTNQSPAISWRYEFPDDYHVHRDATAELWRLSGIYKTGSGLKYAAMGQLLRVRVAEESTPQSDSKWRFHHLFGISQSVVDLQAKSFIANVSVAREALRLAEVDFARNKIWVNQHSFQSTPQSRCQVNRSWMFSDPGATLHMNLQQLECPYFLQKDTPEPFHFYVQPMRVLSGEFGDQEITEGHFWLTHGWGGLPLRQSPVVVDQFFLPLNDTTMLNLVRTRRASGRGRAVLSAQLYADGQVNTLDYRTINLTDVNFWRSDKTNNNYSIGWTVSWPGHTAAIRSVLPNQELNVFGQSRWAGAIEMRVTVDRKHGSSAITRADGSSLYGFAEISPVNSDFE